MNSCKFQTYSKMRFGLIDYNKTDQYIMLYALNDIAQHNILTTDEKEQITKIFTADKTKSNEFLKNLKCFESGYNKFIHAFVLSF
jgi:hypothetical protein